MTSLTKFAIIVAGLAVANMPSVAGAAGYETAGSLLKLCSSSEAVDEVVCLGYLSGVVDAYTDGNQNAYGHKICPPEGISRKAVSNVVVKYLKVHPELHSYDAAPIVYVASALEFPCKDEQE